MVFQDRLGMVHEAMVDMKKVEKTLEFMSRIKKCPVYGTQRTYYRFSEKIPFSRENMERLARSINPTTLYPNDLRTLNQQNVHDRADKPIQLEELQNWLQSGFHYGSLIWDNYKVNCVCDGKPSLIEDLF